MQTRRAQLERSLSQELGRELSARSILFHQALADIAGVSVTDLKCLDYLSRNPRATAGDLARLTGLTTGTITAAIDRLERAGLAHRERSSSDRRKVHILPGNSPSMKRLLPLYEALAGDMSTLIQSYSTPQLAVIEEFLLRSIDILRQNTERAVAGKRTGKRPAPGHASPARAQGPPTTSRSAQIGSPPNP